MSTPEPSTPLKRFLYQEMRTQTEAQRDRTRKWARDREVSSWEFDSADA